MHGVRSGVRHGRRAGAVFGEGADNRPDGLCCDGWDRPCGPVESNDDKLSEKGPSTMKLTTVTHVSVDGVMQGLGGADEDRRGGFERGGWALPLFDDEVATFVNQVYQRADAFLFGRRTYEIFAGSWGAMAEMRAQPIGVALNTMPKYVIST